jgi:hypothetical protein
MYPYNLLRQRGQGDISDPDVVLIGTLLRLSGNVYASFSIPVPLILQGTLDAITSQLQGMGYRVRSNGSSYSAVTFDIEVRAEKPNIQSVLADFAAAANKGLAATWNGTGDEIQNINFSVLYNPRDHGGAPAPENVIQSLASDPTKKSDSTPLLIAGGLLLLVVLLKR